MVAQVQRFWAKLRLDGVGASYGISLCPDTPGHTALSAEIMFGLYRIEVIPPRIYKARGSVEEQVARDTIFHECVLYR